jgi:hypothetical protein
MAEGNAIVATSSAPPRYARPMAGTANDVTAPTASSRVCPTVATTIAASPSRAERLLARNAPRATVPKIARIVPPVLPSTWPARYDVELTKRAQPSGSTDASGCAPMVAHNVSSPKTGRVNRPTRIQVVAGVVFISVSL